MGLMKDTVPDPHVRFALLIDLQNMYHGSVITHGHRPNYGYMISQIKTFNPVSFAFGVQTSLGSDKFRRYLQYELGLQTHFRMPKVHADNTICSLIHVPLTITGMDLLPETNGLILMSGDHNYCPLVMRYLKAGKPVFVVAFQISRELKNIATRFYEVGQDAIDETAERVVMLPDQLGDALERQPGNVL